MICIRHQLTIAMATAVILGTLASEPGTAEHSEKAVEYKPPLLSHDSIQISGKCVRCLIEVRNDMKRMRHDTAMDQLTFAIIERDKFFEITVGKSSRLTLGDCITYRYSKSSGAILDRQYGK